MSKKTEKTIVTFQTTVKQDDQLKALADKRMMDKSVLLRTICREYLTNNKK